MRQSCGARISSATRKQGGLWTMSRAWWSGICARRELTTKRRSALCDGDCVAQRRRDRRGRCQAERANVLGGFVASFHLRSVPLCCLTEDEVEERRHD